MENVKVRERPLVFFQEQVTDVTLDVRNRHLEF